MMKSLMMMVTMPCLSIDPPTRSCQSIACPPQSVRSQEDPAQSFHIMHLIITNDQSIGHIGHILAFQKFFSKHLGGKPEDFNMMTLSETITRVGDISMWLCCPYLVKALKTNQALQVITLLVLIVYCIHSQRVSNRQDTCKRESQSYLLGERKSAEERDCHKEAPTHCLKVSCYQTILPPFVVMMIHPPGI